MRRYNKNSCKCGQSSCNSCNTCNTEQFPTQNIQQLIDQKFANFCAGIQFFKEGDKIKLNICGVIKEVNLAECLRIVSIT